MRKTSIDVFNQIQAEGLLSKLRWQVYRIVYQYGPLTAQEAWHYLRDDQARIGEARINGITPRFSELAERGVIYEVGTRKCRITGRECIIWDVTDQLPSEPAKNETIQQRCARLETENKKLREENEKLRYPDGQGRLFMGH